MLLRKIAAAVLVGLLTVASVPQASAQEITSALRGQVSDTAGNAVSGATVTIVHTPTGTRSVQTTNAGGVYDARGLRVGGPYTVEITASGYQGKKFDDLFLTVGETSRLNADLEGGIAEVVVSASAIRDQAIGAATNLDRDQIDSIVSINRDIRDLARRDPLVSANLRGDGGIGGMRGDA